MKPNAAPKPSEHANPLADSELALELQAFVPDAICSFCGLWRSEASHLDCGDAAFIEDNS